MRRSTPRLRTLVALTAIGALVMAACGDDGAPTARDDTGTTSVSIPEDVLRGMTRNDSPDVSSVSLPDASQDGADFSFVAPAGGLLVVYFGYTSCPDVCPTTLADARTALDELGEEAEQVELAMVTIDPARDTPEVLTGYVQSFVPDAHALTTTDDTRLQAAADAFGAGYRIETGDDGEPVVEHTGFLYVVDDDGRLVLAWPYGQSAADISHDLHLLLQET